MEISERLQALIKALPEVIASAFSEKNRERFGALEEQVKEMTGDTVGFIEEFRADVGMCVEIVLEMVADPLSAAGIELDFGGTRDLNEMKEYVRLALKEVNLED